MKTVRGSQVEKPLELDLISSPTTIYLRQDIHQVKETRETGEVVEWEYQEEEYEKTDENIALVTKLYTEQKNNETESLTTYYTSTQTILPTGGE